MSSGRHVTTLRTFSIGDGRGAPGGSIGDARGAPAPPIRDVARRHCDVPMVVMDSVSDKPTYLGRPSLATLETAYAGDPGP